MRPILKAAIPYVVVAVVFLYLSTWCCRDSGECAKM
jgi:hypothetical protein